MSHEYYFTRDNTSTGEKVASVFFSNINHENWQEKAQLSRQMRQIETGVVEDWPYHTTIHDIEPVTLFSYELETYINSASEAYGDEQPDHMDRLYDFIATANAIESETSVAPTIFFY